MTKENVTSAVVKCEKCTHYFIPGLDGDADVCDSCIAKENEKKPYIEGDCYGGGE